MNAPTIASQQPEGLWQFIVAFSWSFEMQVLIGLIFAGALGQISSYTYKWFKNEIEGNLWQYLFRDNYKKTGLTFIGYLTLAAGAVSLGMFTGANEEFVGWKNVLTWGLSNGFGLDLALNRGVTKVWTATERTAKRKDIKAKAKVPTK